MPNIHAMLLVLVGAIACFFAGAIAGHNVTSDHMKAMQRQAEAAAAASYARKVEENNALVNELEQNKVKREALAREIMDNAGKVIVRPIYQSECMDDDGVQLANRALAGATLAGVTDTTLSRPAKPKRWKGKNHPAAPDRSKPSLS